MSVCLRIFMYDTIRHYTNLDGVQYFILGLILTLFMYINMHMLINLVKVMYSLCIYYTCNQ